MTSRTSCWLFVPFMLLFYWGGHIAYGQANINESTLGKSGGWVDSPYVTPDGQQLYFMFSRYNYFPAILGNAKPVLGTRRLPGHHDNNINPYEDSDIYVAQRMADGSWSSPQNLSGVNDNHSDCCAMVVKGPPQRIYYQRNTENNGRDLVYRELGSGGVWGPMVVLPSTINSPDNEDNIHVSADQRRIYFTSDRPGGQGEHDIWFSYSSDGTNWSQAVNVGPVINSEQDEDQFWISDIPDANGNYEVYFNRTTSQIWRSSWNAKDGFAAPTQVNLGQTYVGEASVTADNREMYYASGDPKTETITLMRARRKADGNWDKGTPLP